MIDEPTPIFDDFNIDLFIKVLSHTLFSPFFIFFLPLLNFARGSALHNSNVLYPIVWLVLLCVYYVVKESSRVWQNGASWLWRPARLDWGEQIVVITGGASGVGALLANTLAVRNVTVVVLDINPLVTENYNIYYYKCDVSNWEEVQAVAEKIREEVGDPTVIVNNAGVVQGKSILDLKPADVNQSFGVNVVAHYWMLKAFLPAMIEQKQGHIITVSSVLGLSGVARLSDYCATKAALISLNQSLRRELDSIHRTPAIRTTVLIPGQLYTPLFSTGKFRTNPILKFLAPTVPPHTLVKKIIATLDDQESKTVYLPFFTSCVELLNFLPSWAKDFMQWLSGADETMQGFTKVTGVREDEKIAASIKDAMEPKA